MLTLLKLLQSLVKTLHSEGAPWQIAGGVTLGAALGLTPLMSGHNLVIVLVICVLNVSVGGALLGLAVFAPLGFLLDPLFDRLGRQLLVDTPVLEPMWTALYNIPVVPYSGFNNSIVLGSLVTWLVLTAPIYALAYIGVLRYRATVGERVRQSRFYKVVTTSRLYNVYTWFRPQ